MGYSVFSNGCPFYHREIGCIRYLMSHSFFDQGMPETPVFKVECAFMCMHFHSTLHFKYYGQLEVYIVTEKALIEIKFW